MKKTLFTLALTFFTLIIISPVSASDKKTKKASGIAAEDVVRAKELNERLAEIQEMDKSSLSSSERRVLRTEVKAIKSELAEISGGVYLSLGAIIVILLLLILLL